MSHSWDDADSPVFSRVLRQRRRRHVAIALLAAGVAVILALSLFGPSSTGVATVPLPDLPGRASPAPAAPSASSVSPDSPNPSAASDPTPAPLAEPAAETALASSKDLIREPVLEAAGAAPPAAVGTSSRPALSPEPASTNADPSVRAASEVRQALQAWADAWSRRDFAAYRAAYVPTFRGSLRTREEWLAQRQARIVPRQRIEVIVTDVVITVDGSQARVDFRQLYASDNWRDDTRRTIQMQKVAGAWLIAGESNR